MSDWIDDVLKDMQGEDKGGGDGDTEKAKARLAEVMKSYQMVAEKAFRNYLAVGMPPQVAATATYEYLTHEMREEMHKLELQMGFMQGYVEVAVNAYLEGLDEDEE